jgi:predicted Zn-dependent protease
MTGNARGAAEALTQAAALDPTAPIVASVGAVAQQVSGRTKTALAEAQRSMQLNPGMFAPRLMYGTVLLDAGMPREAVKELERARQLDPKSPVTLGVLGAAYAQAGERARAEEILAQLEKMSSVPRAPSAIAKLRLALGDKDGALAWLAKAADARDPAFASEPLGLKFWDPVRSDPRFAAIVRRVGLGPSLIVIKRDSTGGR